MLHRLLIAICLCCVPYGSTLAADLTLAADQGVSLRIDNGVPGTSGQLHGRDSRMQLITTAEHADGSVQDWTHKVTYSAEPKEMVRIDDALVTPLANGFATIVARDDAGNVATTEIEISGIDENLPISFPSQVVPIFTKLGCNSGGCHGKVAGQNGFRLSLLGFEPRDDYEYLVKESRGRRVSPATPDHSLLLLKAINASPHGGGQRLEQDSHEYRMLRRWIAQGLPYGSGDEPQVTSIDIYPSQRRLQSQGDQQLSVVATYSDGTVEDVTRAAVYESNDTQMADVTGTGLVKLADLAGDVAVMARYQGHVTVFRADIPMQGHSAAWQSDSAPQPRNVVDEFVFKKLRSLGIPPSQPCDDAVYLRRVTLDLVGRLPTLSETEDFLSDSDAEQRDRLIERLLASEQYAEFFAGKWNTILKNRRDRGGLEFATIAFHDWIKESLRENKPYDQFVRQILTASGSVASNPPVVWFREVPDTNQRIEDAAQLFLGQRIQCARCHHHPYEKWSQADYTRLSAFFSTVAKKNDQDPGEPSFIARVGGASAPHPKTRAALGPAGLDGESLAIQPTDDPRSHLADWMTDPTNPFFARALVNRYWKHFLGRGLVEPEDDMRVTNPPSNPELLDAMARFFVESGYDLKALARLIVQSNTYALDYDASDANLGDRRSYARFYPKRLTAEVLLDAVDTVTGFTTRFDGMPPGTRAVGLPDTGFASYFLDVFGQPSSTTACECERSQEANLAQSLHLLNSAEIQNKLSADSGRAARLAADQQRTDEAKIRELYWIALSRAPSDHEVKATLTYLAGKENRRAAYEDVIWSLINSKEFVFNH
jgi:hypothetical protein